MILHRHAPEILGHTRRRPRRRIRRATRTPLAHRVRGIDPVIILGARRQTRTIVGARRARMRWADIRITTAIGGDLHPVARNRGAPVAGRGIPRKVNGRRAAGGRHQVLRRTGLRVHPGCDRSRPGPHSARVERPDPVLAHRGERLRGMRIGHRVTFGVIFHFRPVAAPVDGLFNSVAGNRTT